MTSPTRASGEGKHSLFNRPVEASQNLCRTRTTFFSIRNRAWSARKMICQLLTIHSWLHHPSHTTLLHNRSKTSVDRWDLLIHHHVGVMYTCHLIRGRRQPQHCQPCTKPHSPALMKWRTMMIRVRSRLLLLHHPSSPNIGMSLLANVLDLADAFRSMTSYRGRTEEGRQVSPRKVDYPCL
jgi:hypothetical protein